MEAGRFRLDNADASSSLRKSVMAWSARHSTLDPSSRNRGAHFIWASLANPGLKRDSMDINQVGVVLMGTVLGWFLMFAVRRYKVQWGAFAAFMATVFGVSLLSFLYARD